MNLFMRFFDVGLRREVVEEWEEDVEPELGALPSPGEIGVARKRKRTVSASRVNWKRTLVLYLLVAAGALCRSLLEGYQRTQEMAVGPQHVLISLVLAALAFRVTFNRRLTAFGGPWQFFLAFENGFFVDAVVGTVGPLLIW